MWYYTVDYAEIDNEVACVAEVRNILLQEEPHLLDSILIKSLDEQHLTGQVLHFHVRRSNHVINTM